MRIIHICLSSFYIDNYGYQENMLPKYHVKLGYEVMVLASLVSFNQHGEQCILPMSSDYISSDGYKVKRIDYRNRKKYNLLLRRYHGVYSCLKDFSPDIIFIHGASFWDIHKVAQYVKERRNQGAEIQVFVDNHADWVNSGRNWLSLNILHKIIWRRCHQVIEPYTSKFYGVLPIRCEFLKQVYNVPSNKVELLLLGVDDIALDNLRKNVNRYEYLEQLGIDSSHFIICTGGKLDDKKNTMQLIEAIKMEPFNSIDLLVFGTMDKEYEEKMKSLLNNRNIHFLGWQSQIDINKIFLISDLAVFPGTHSVLWEQAVGCGIPCIFQRWKGIEHLDIGGNCIFLENGKNVKEIYRNLYEIIYDKNYYNFMKTISQESGIKRFSYSEISKYCIQKNEYYDV